MLWTGFKGVQKGREGHGVRRHKISHYVRVPHYMSSSIPPADASGSVELTRIKIPHKMSKITTSVPICRNVKFLVKNFFHVSSAHTTECEH